MTTRPLPPPAAVVVAVTGTELRRPGEPLARGEIYDANGLILATQIAQHRRDRRAARRPSPTTLGATRAAIERGLEADVLVTSGGVSVGVYDLVRATEAELGVEEVFWRVAVRPGKPIAFGVRGRTLVFGLPGNPVSSLVGFELFVRPALLALQGLAEPEAGVPPGSARPAGEADRSATRSCARGTAVEDGDVVVLDPLDRTGVAHDRAGRDGRRARARSARGGRARAPAPPSRYLSL